MDDAYDTLIGCQTDQEKPQQLSVWDGKLMQVESRQAMRVGDEYLVADRQKPNKVWLVDLWPYTLQQVY